MFRNLKMSGFNGVLSAHPVRYLLDGEHGSCKMENIVVENCDIDVDGAGISLSVEPGVTLRDFGNVVFRKIRLKSKKALVLNGTGDTPLRNVAFEDVSGTVEAERPIDMSNVEGIRFDHFDVRSGRGKRSAAATNKSDGWERGL